MNKEAKKEVLKALSNMIITKMEARLILQTKGIILIDLSSHSNGLHPIELILEKIPEVKKEFKRIIYLGEGRNDEDRF